MAMYHQIDQTRAARLLDAAQAAAYPHMGEGGSSFIDRLVERVRGAVEPATELAERMIWNGRVLGTARAIKATAHKMFERGLVA